MHGWLKLILDGSSLENSGITGSGGVIRDMWVTEFKVFSRIYIYIYSVKMVFAVGGVVNSKNKV